MKPSAEGNSYVMRLSEADFDALPAGRPGPAVGDCSAEYLDGFVVMRRETTLHPGDTVVIYPAVLS